MHRMLKVSVVLLAAATAFPFGAQAATAPGATVVMGDKSDAVQVAKLKPMIGKWTKAELSALDAAKSIKVYDTKTLYSAADQKTVAAAETSSSANLKKFHDALMGDAGLKTWFATNNISIDRVAALTDTKGNIALYLY